MGSGSNSCLTDPTWLAKWRIAVGCMAHICVYINIYIYPAFSRVYRDFMPAPITTNCWLTHDPNTTFAQPARSRSAPLRQSPPKWPGGWAFRQLKDHDGKQQGVNIFALFENKSKIKFRNSKNQACWRESLQKIHQRIKLKVTIGCDFNLFEKLWVKMKILPNKNTETTT